MKRYSYCMFFFLCIQVFLGSAKEAYDPAFLDQLSFSNLKKWREQSAQVSDVAGVDQIDAVIRKRFPEGEP
ncbi:MAG: hypothetical protein WBQ73_01245, partial [Candidatus Babeliales bacterium]